MPPLESSMPVDLPAKAVTPFHGVLSSSFERKHGPRHTKEGKAVKPVPDVEVEVKQTVEIDRRSSHVAQRYQQSNLYKPKPRIGQKEAQSRLCGELLQFTNHV